MECPPTINTRTVFSNWAVLLGLCALIFVQSHGLVLTNIPMPMHVDKVLHFFCFALLAILFYRAYQCLPLRPSVKILVVLSALSAIVYGVGDEFHQSFVPFRVSDRLDIAADAAGALFGLGSYLLWRCRGRRQTEPSIEDQCFS